MYIHTGATSLGALMLNSIAGHQVLARLGAQA